MALRLKAESTRSTYGNEEFIVEGKIFHLYLDDPNEREHVKKALCLENYEFFKEQTGLGHWVLYNPKQYKIAKNRDHKDILIFNSIDYDGSKLEVPINASSCCGMFSWVELPEELELTSMFDTSNVVDMSLMFAGCIIPKYFSFGTHFHTYNVRDMKYMFYKTTLKRGVKLTLDTSHVRDFNHMFAHTIFSDEILLDFDLSHARDVSFMFNGTCFQKDPVFGKKFEVDDYRMNTDSMFLQATLDDEIVGRDILLTHKINNR